MAKVNFKVDRLIITKPTAADLLYPAMPSFEDAIPNESEEESRKRVIQNQRRKIDWKNECKLIEFHGPLFD